MPTETEEPKAKLNTKLESEGAEFLVLGQLLIRKIPASKAYTNQPNYDLVAYSPKTDKSATIQIKARWSKKATQFPVGKLRSDFVVLVALNRDPDGQEALAEEPEYYVLPKNAALSLVRDADRKVPFINRDRQKLHQYRSQWEPVRLFLDSFPRRNLRKSK
jgi:hypothetical protein